MSAQDLDENITDYERLILDNIDQFGCHVTHVFDGEGEAPAFSYSTGFTHSLEQGEVIVFGLSSELMHAMVNGVMRQCRDDGLVLADGVRISGLLEGFEVAVRAIPPARIEREYLNSAMWHHLSRYGSNLTQAYQLIWPGAVDGLFPWDEGCDDYVISQQPALYQTSIH